MQRRDVVILGSTGSIGTHALDIVRANPDRFRVVALTAGGSNPELFDQQVAELGPGSFFGDLALLDNSPRNAQARAVDSCEMAVFFRADFLGLLETDAVIGYKISLALARHIGLRLREWMGTGRPQLEAL